MCDLQHKTTLRSILITSVITWYEVDKVVVKTLQRRRASGSSVSGKLQPALKDKDGLLPRSEYMEFGCRGVHHTYTYIYT